MEEQQLRAESQAKLDPSAAITLYRVGDLVVDVVHERVMRDGVEIHLAKLTFDLLITLVRAAPNVVSFDQLMSRVWPGLIVGLETISQRVMKLRAALDDNSKEPRYVAGVRGRGYRMIVPVEPVSAGTLATSFYEAGGSPNRLLHSQAPGNHAENLAAYPQQPTPRRASSWVALYFPRSVAVIGAILLPVFAAGTLWLLLRGPHSQEPRGTVDSSPIPAVSTKGTPTQPSETSSHKVRLAILPLENLSPDPANAFFADGLHEEIISTIAQRAPTVEVISRTTMMTYRQIPPKSLLTVARELQASHVIEGSIRREANKVRLTVQLIDARSDREIWSQTYDRTLSSALTLQSEVAADIGSQLPIHLAGTAKSDPSFTTRNQKAYDAYLKARLAAQTVFPFSSTIQQQRGLLEMLDYVVVEDPNFTPARVTRLQAGILMFIGGRDRSNARLRQIREDLAVAQRLSGEHPWVLLAASSYSLHIALDPARSLHYIRAAQSAGAADNISFTQIAAGLMCLALYDEALPIYQYASTLDPHNPWLFMTWAQALWDVRRPADALRALDTAIQLGAPVQIDRGELLFAFTGQIEFWRSGADSTLPLLDPQLRLPLEFELLRFEHRYAELRQELSAAPSQLIPVQSTPVISGIVPAALYRGWTDLLLGHSAEAAKEGDAVLEFVGTQSETQWNRIVLQMLRAEGIALKGHGPAAVSAARQLLQLVSRAKDPIGWAYFSAPSAARVLAWARAKDEASALLEELADAIPGQGPAMIARDPLYSVPLAGNARYRRLAERLELQTDANRPELDKLAAHSGLNSTSFSSTRIESR